MVVSDCSPRAWMVPAECELPRLTGTDELVIDSTLPLEMLASVTSVRIRQVPDVMFLKLVTCTLTVEYEGYPMSDFRCSACTKVHNAPRPGAFCPRCGARVVRVVRTVTS